MGYSITASSDNCYPGTTVLINKLGLKNQDALNQAEKIAVTLRSAEIENSDFSGAFTFDYYCALHKRLFGDLYDWAGELRTVNLSKKGTSFYPAESLREFGNAKFAYLQSEKEFSGLEHDEFACKVADFYHEMNMLHPFREGNGRVQRLFFTLLIRRAGYEISFSDTDPDELMIATIFAAQGVMDMLKQFFISAIC